ncbi:hypothetical protein PLICRDRAFT_331314 [Plicaturopsis crispa FD-325 SS-3]|uniref:Ctf8-domain-containing protein n=1 Tax=Plicaturopsis crispa FD-325 SS-3 TaxID=944288 RepID=A0A0C9SYJ3_PLICR|nr:hypothetical protein PLICRDRAFT_331314 [Plicaturopsis crispa FD-325 SS-3]
MIIPINIPASGSSTTPKLPPQLATLGNDEVVLIELQGALEVECNAPTDRDGQMVGKLRMDEGSGKPTLFIGHHLLEGKIVTLPKPIAVIHRPARSSQPTDEEGGEGEEGGAQGQVGWDMLAIVKRKIVFSKRPMPIVGLGMGASVAAVASAGKTS